MGVWCKLQTASQLSANDMKKPNLSSLVKASLLGLTLVLAACGGTDPNDSVPAVTQATCKIKANWNKVQIGHSVSSVLGILGQPNQVTATNASTTYTYEACRIFHVLVTKDDPATEANETETLYRLMSGSVVFTGGYVSAIGSPKYDDTETVIRELTDAEVLAYK